MDDSIRGKDMNIVFFKVRIGRETHLASYSMTANSVYSGVKRSWSYVENSSPLVSLSRIAGAKLPHLHTSSCRVHGQHVYSLNTLT